MAPVIIIFSINIGGVILSAASLSFLGFGLPPAVPEWGGLLSRDGREYMEMAPYLAFWPGLCLTITIYSLNMFGDAVRDLLDPRLRGGQGSYGTSLVKRKRGFLARLINPSNGNRTKNFENPRLLMGSHGKHYLFTILILLFCPFKSA